MAFLENITRLLNYLDSYKSSGIPAKNTLARSLYERLVKFKGSPIGNAELENILKIVYQHLKRLERINHEADKGYNNGDLYENIAKFFYLHLAFWKASQNHANFKMYVEKTLQGDHEAITAIRETAFHGEINVTTDMTTYFEEHLGPLNADIPNRDEIVTQFVGEKMEWGDLREAFIGTKVLDQQAIPESFQNMEDTMLEGDLPGSPVIEAQRAGNVDVETQQGSVSKIKRLIEEYLAKTPEELSANKDAGACMLKRMVAERLLTQLKGLTTVGNAITVAWHDVLEARALLLEMGKHDKGEQGLLKILDAWSREVNTLSPQKNRPLNLYQLQKALKGYALKASCWYGQGVLEEAKIKTDALSTECQIVVNMLRKPGATLTYEEILLACEKLDTSMQSEGAKLLETHRTFFNKMAGVLSGVFDIAKFFGMRGQPQIPPRIFGAAAATSSQKTITVTRRLSKLLGMAPGSILPLDAPPQPPNAQRSQESQTAYPR